MPVEGEVTPTMVDHCGHTGSCGSRAPVLERLCYFFGQFLEAGDFRDEQAYFLTRLNLLTKHGIGWGVACGLDVELTLSESESCRERPDVERLALTVRPGVAFDNCGNVIVLDRCAPIMLWNRLGELERKILADGKPLYVTVEHIARPVKPAQAADRGCDPLATKQYARIRDETRICIRADRPKQPHCDQCLDDCGDPAVLLAAIRWRRYPDGYRPEVWTDGRRLLARHHLGTISGLGWVHGGSYPRRAAEAVLERGIGVRFSRPVQIDSIQPGVVDLIVYEGGGGRREGWYVKEAAVTAQPLPHAPKLCTEMVVKAAQPEGFQVGDRITLMIKASFLLDECGRAVSGAHLGGAVPYDPALTTVDDQHPQPYPRLRLGRVERVEGGDFESWIIVRRNDAASTEAGSA
jgi:hypothetical protein